jgi:hypothetical protein
VPHTGKSFRIMAIDIQTIRDGKIARTYHSRTGSVRWDSFAQSSVPPSSPVCALVRHSSRHQR